MNSSRSTFLSGLVLGAVLGLVAGHFTLWKSSTPDETKVTELLDSPYFLQEMNYDLGEKSANIPPEYLEFDETPTEPRVSVPFENAIAFDTEVTRTEGLLPEGQEFAELDQSVMPIPLDPEVTDEPQALSIPEAQPLQALTEKSESEIRELINSELPQASQSQRDVWFESLKDLNSSDARGVLKMWKMFGGPDAGLTDFSPPTEPTFASPTPLDQPDQKQLIKFAIDTHRQNLLMHSVPGYKQLIPRFKETIVEGSPQIFGIEFVPDLTRGQVCNTSHILDFSIDGPGLFQVKSGSKVLYTACGQLSLNNNRQLCVVIADEEYVLQPEITIPETSGTLLLNQGTLHSYQQSGDSQDQVSQELGQLQVSILGRHDLTPVGNGLFEAAEDAQVFTQRAQVTQGKYECSNVNVKATQSEIERLEKLLGD